MRTPKSRLGDLKRLRQMAEPGHSARSRAPAAAAVQGGDLQHKKSPEHKTPAKAATLAVLPSATILDTDDIALFRRTMKAVTPIKKSGRILPAVSPTAAGDILRQRRLAATGQEISRLPPVSDVYSPHTLSHDDTRHLQAGYGPDLIKGLKRGKWPAQASIDLHGSTLDQARLRLDQFLATCIEHRIKSVRIVHGKGYGSKNGQPILKETVRRWLSQLKHVVAYVECDEREGGSGAVHVLLKVDR